MPIEMPPYLSPNRPDDTVVEQVPRHQGISVGMIARGVFLGNLITAVVVGVAWWIATHLI